MVVGNNLLIKKYSLKNLTRLDLNMERKIKEQKMYATEFQTIINTPYIKISKLNIRFI